MRILLVEDAEDLGDAVASKLRLLGHAVEWAKDGRSGRELALAEPFDAVILDINLPGEDGFSVLRAMRAARLPTPVLVVTARSEVDDKISLLDLGADDYLVKPFDLRELEARLRALLRRRAGALSSTVAVGELVIDHAAGEARLGDRPLDLSRREFRLLEILTSRLGQVIPKQRLMDQLFSLDDEVSENALELYVSRLRRKLQGAPVTIATVRGAGYAARAAHG
ncbi:response regulator transcription factor [Alsobacter sp. SYSU M60028]|uniref:Response regulator transcription factor n=1 Tax=Alsobacter ponti TaxID=2962936 RepID=A0ABT1L7X4_9HYPH|nr:response regulator transcription factor [Alsobacter ponti]MCP8937605.1 response regulator transcription factor [Alsobacter ponti]